MQAVYQLGIGIALTLYISIVRSFHVSNFEFLVMFCILILTLFPPKMAESFSVRDINNEYLLPALKNINNTIQKSSKSPEPSSENQPILLSPKLLINRLQLGKASDEAVNALILKYKQIDQMLCQLSAFKPTRYKKLIGD